jgi:hypothetical protein
MNAYSILEQASASRKGGIRLTGAPLALAPIFNSMRRIRTKYPGSFGHLVFKRRSTHVDILNGNNILDSLEEIFTDDRRTSQESA